MPPTHTTRDSSMRKRRNDMENHYAPTARGKARRTADRSSGHSLVMGIPRRGRPQDSQRHAGAACQMTKDIGRGG